jgi:hypothetical protein
VFSVFVCSPSPYRLGLCLLVVVVCVGWRRFEGLSKVVCFFSR